MDLPLAWLLPCEHINLPGVLWAFSPSEVDGSHKGVMRRPCVREYCEHGEYRAGEAGGRMRRDAWALATDGWPHAR